MSSLKRVRPPQTKKETLEAVALRRDGVVHSYGFRAHWKIRARLGDKEPNQERDGDECGFLTSTGRFVSRSEAVVVAVQAGQLRKEWLTVGRPLLSSDVW